MSISGVIDRKAMADRDAHYKLAGPVEMDDSYFGGSKAGKQGRGAALKATVVISVEDRGRKAGFAKIHKLENLSSDNIRLIAAEGFAEGTVAPGSTPYLPTSKGTL
ncbi:MAG: transposase [Desulfomonilaceae bacterium]